MSGHTLGKLCVFGCFDDSEMYPRNRVLIDALASNFSEVVEVRPKRHIPAKSNQLRISSLRRLAHTTVGILRDFFSLLGQRDSLRGADVYYIPYPAYLDFLFLRLLSWGTNRIVVVDAFLCLHDTLVLDRKMIAAGGIIDQLVSWLEKQTLSRADLVFIDTNQQKEILVSQYSLDETKVAVIPVGIDESVWFPAPKLPLETEFFVLFWGTFIPLHGVETIVNAARILQDSHPGIKFRMVGDGQTAGDISSQMDKACIENIEWCRSLLSAPELRSQLDASHCVLGIFGESNKAANVIPYKAYQAMACNKIFISRSGAAFEELLNEQDVPGLRLIPAANADELARSIVIVFESYGELADEINTRILYDQGLSNSIINRRIFTALEAL